MEGWLRKDEFPTRMSLLWPTRLTSCLFGCRWLKPAPTRPSRWRHPSRARSQTSTRRTSSPAPRLSWPSACRLATRRCPLRRPPSKCGCTLSVPPLTLRVWLYAHWENRAVHAGAHCAARPLSTNMRILGRRAERLCVCVCEREREREERETQLEG
jgi:hypothetical protein